MPDGRHDGDLNVRYCSGNGFRVEDPKVFHGSAAPGEQNEVRLQGRRAVEGRQDLLFRLVALYRRGYHGDCEGGKSTTPNRQNVLECSAGRGCDDGNMLRHLRHGTLAVCVEQAFGIQLAFQSVKRRSQRAFSCGFHMFNDDLKLAPALVEADATAQQNLLPVGRLHARAAVGVCEHSATNLGIVVLQCEIPVPRSGSGKTREFSTDPDLVKALLDGHARLTIELANRQHLAFGCGVWADGETIRHNVAGQIF